MKTSHLDIKLIYSNQAQKEILINEAFIKIDSLLNSGIISMKLNTPPENPKGGDKYIVASNPQGVWSQHYNEIAYYYSKHWYFVAPKTGSLVWINDEKNIYFHENDKWNKYTSN